MDKTLSTAANLAQLLPTGTVLTFQALAPSFTRGGACYTSNRCLISVLIALNAVFCVFFSITDSLVGADNRLYYGVATLRSLYVFNYNGADEEVRRRVLGDLEEYRLRPLDYVHAVFTVLVFLTIAFGDAMVQHCLFPDAGPNARELLVNLPLGAGVVSTLVFIVFPTSRKGIGYTNTAPTSHSGDGKRDTYNMGGNSNISSSLRLQPAMAASWVARIPESSEMQEGHAARVSPQSKQSSWVVDKTLSTASNLAQLLPTATVLAFQSLSPSFTRRGECYATNRELTCVLIALSAVSCAFFSITDSLVGADNKLYYGVATMRGLYVFNCNEANEEERRRVFGDLDEYRLRPLDCVHAVFAVLVFLTLAFSDAMVQHCLFPDSGTNARELLVNLPLGAGVVSTLVFMLFPTSRKGIGYTNVTPTSR
ncbi:unnamed protein product [Musa acuminata subsp. malaccensis]|nr:unnamed protein product [Musa acuminata subsp. malaccensis]